MEANFEKRYRRAIAAAMKSDRLEPRADDARYDIKSGRVIVNLTNGTTFIFPPTLAEGLSSATSGELENITITPSGDGLRWGDLDVDLSLPGLLMGIFGGKQWMSELGRRGGQAKTEAKTVASRENGRKGGRPRKSTA